MERANSTTETTETTTTAETTTTTQETTTTTQETTTTTEAPTTTAKAHPENDRIMENLRNFYKSHTIVDGVPVDEDGTTKYTKFAIADFDGDGENEVAINHLNDGTNYGMGQVATIIIYNDNISNNDILKRIGYSELSDNVYLDNGIAYVSDVMIADHNSRANDGLKDRYYIINNSFYEKLNYSKDNIGDQTSDYVLSYYEQEGKINKYLHTLHDGLFSVEKTQAEYESDKAILESGNVMNIEVKEFTAENLGL